MNLTMSQIIDKIEGTGFIQADSKQIRGLNHQRNELYKALVIAEEALTNFYGGEADDSPTLKHIRNTLKNAERT